MKWKTKNECSLKVFNNIQNSLLSFSFLWVYVVFIAAFYNKYPFTFSYFLNCYLTFIENFKRFQADISSMKLAERIKKMWTIKCQ